MSKSDGPAANGFESPRKVGWLYKQGGSGVTSHWRKRWFVADHHYLFYYKKPDDKGPVGILCLPEYESCYKTEGKEWKKPNTFLLEKGKDKGDATDSSSKSYVLHSDTEDEMLEWMKALKEEMKPMLVDGNKHEAIPNGRGPTPPAKATKGGKGKAESDVKIDPLAFNELSVLAAETPKLTHLTTSRPKMKNRRPPKKYAVFHEDDSKEDESPPPSPTASHKPLPTPPTPSPSSQAKKGHRPSAPIMPKMKPLTPPKTPRNEISPIQDTAADTEGALSEVKKKPTPPRKPSKERPLPPRKPSKTVIETPPTESTEPVVPVIKPRPPQPPAKPRASTTNAPPPVTPIPVPKPRPRRRTQGTIPSNDKPSSTLNEETTPLINEETTPIITEEITFPVEEAEEEVPLVHAFSPIPEETTPPSTDEATPSIESSREPSIIEENSESKEESIETATDDVMEIAKDDPKISDDSKTNDDPKANDNPQTNDDPKISDNVMEAAKDDTVAIDDTNSNDDTKMNNDTKDTEQAAPVEIKDQEIIEKEKEEEVAEDENVVPSEVDEAIPPEVKEIAAEEKQLQDEPVAKGEEAEKEDKESLESEPLYEDMTMGDGPPSKEESDNSEYEMVDYFDPQAAPNSTDSADKTVGVGIVPEPLETSSQGQSTSSYVMMNPSDTPSDEYIEIIQDNVFKEKVDSIEYDKPSEWVSPVNESPRSTKVGEYDVPRPASSQSDRGSPIMSSGSTGSRSHGSPGLSRIGSRGQSDRLGTLRAEGGDRSIERDRSLSGGSQGYPKGTPPLSPLDSTHNVPGTLRQVKEILRMAQLVKAEADEMREEAKRELELARREKHDAELLKKNAAQILKMAKERLSDSKSR